MNKNKDILSFYQAAKNHCIDNGYIFEISMVKNRRFEDMTPDLFFKAFVYVVLNSGMKNQIAHLIYEKFIIAFGNNPFVGLNNIRSGLNVIGHPGKREAIRDAFYQYRQWFMVLKKKKTLDEQLCFLESLPWIGPITKYHLARNLGLDVAKPDRHMSRVAGFFGFDDVQEMCRQLSEQSGDRIGVVDVVLWRAMNLSNGGFLEEFKNRIIQGDVVK